MKVTLTGATAVIASAGALFFALGYVIVNARLATYGVNEIAPPSARFIAVGLLAGAYLGAAYLVRFLPTLQRRALAPRRAGRSKTARGSLRRAWPVARAILSLAAALVVISSLEAGIVEYVAQPIDDREPGYLLQFLLAWNVLPMVGFALLPLQGPWYGPHFDLRPARAALSVLRVVAAIPFIVAAVALYAQTAFKYAPQWIGGGRLASVQLILADDDRGLCPECEIEGTTYVLLEDGDRIVLFLNDDGQRRVIELPRSAIRSVVHPPR